MQGLLHARAQLFVFTGDHCRGQRVISHFLGQIRPGQHANTRLGSDLLENLAHQLEGLGLDALGGADQHLACQQWRNRLKSIAQSAGRQCDQHQLGLLQYATEVTGRLDTAMQLDPLQVARVFATLAHLLGLLGVTHPLQDALAVLCQQVGQSGAEAAAAEYGNGLELCHRSSE